MRLLCTVSKEEELERAAQVLLEKCKNRRVFVFSGALEAAKQLLLSIFVRF